MTINMTLRETQSEFAFQMARLILYAYQQGYELTISHVFRCQDCKVGKKSSLHKSKLAVDLNLFKDGEYLSKTSDHEFLGKWWKEQHSLARWGGDFKRSDGNHYSFTRWGRA